MLWLVALIPYILQIILIVHVIKTHRPFYWLYVLIFLPSGLGGIAYVLVEILPEYFNRSTRQKIGVNLTNIINPNAKIEELEKQLKAQKTIANKMLLAEAYIDGQKYESAINLYQECLTGPYKDDKAILFPLAKSYFFMKDYSKAQEIIKSLKEHSSLSETQEVLFEILIEDKNGEDTLERLQTLYEKSASFEVGYYYIEKLIHNQQSEKAQEILLGMKESIKTYKKFASAMGKDWINKSETLLKKG
ncbi:MAG: hypothetical protein ACRC4W_09410 [Treponemataceae bacterium]